MIKSMTGYGRGEATVYNRRFIVEIKSVNHRYNDITVKMPRILLAFEEQVKKFLNTEISRGKTDVYITYETFSKDDVKIKVNEALADAYYNELIEMKSRYGIDEPISLSLLARFPDIVTVDKKMDDEETIQQMWEALEMALKDALVQFTSMRQKEGAALKADILQKTKGIQRLVNEVEKRAPLVAAEHREKMLQRIQEILSLSGQELEVDEGRILTEVAIFADKSCIDEEITRMNSHLEQMPQILEENDTVGRKLDFLLQEMNREVNTMGSKSNDVHITKMIVTMKSEVEKIREQIQNIE